MQGIQSQEMFLGSVLCLCLCLCLCHCSCLCLYVGQVMSDSHSWLIVEIFSPESTSSTQPTLYSSNRVWLIEREQSAKWDCEIVKCRLQTLERWLIRLSELVCSGQKVTMMMMKTTNLDFQHIQITKTTAAWIYHLLLICIIMISWTFVVVRVGTRQACSSFIASDSEMSTVTPWE